MLGEETWVYSDCSGDTDITEQLFSHSNGFVRRNSMPSLKDRTGETRTMNCGMKATIIQYFTSHDITIRFEDGIVLEHKFYGGF